MMTQAQAAIRSGARLLSSAAAPSPAVRLAIMCSGTARTVSSQSQALTQISWKRQNPAVPADAKRPADGAAVGVGKNNIGKTNGDLIPILQTLEALRLLDVGESAATVPKEPQRSQIRKEDGVFSSGEGSISIPEGYSAMNRNARKPKRANHGARPCSRHARKMKRRKWGNPRR